MASKDADILRTVLKIFKAGRVNAEQQGIIDQIEYDLGDKTYVCEHKNGYFSDAQDNFSCRDCGASVPRP